MIRAFLKRFVRREGGGASIEFVFLFPVIVMIFAFTMEAGTLAARQVLLDRALADISRTLKLRSGNLPSEQALIERVCEIAPVFPNCTEVVTVGVAKIDTVNWNISDEYIQCVDLDDTGFQPVNALNGASENELVMLKVCATFEPLFPYVGLGAALRKVSEKDYSIASAIAFVNEPR